MCVNTCMHAYMHMCVCMCACVHACLCVVCADVQGSQKGFSDPLALELKVVVRCLA